MNYNFIVKLCCTDLKPAQMSTFGHLLICPLCQELFTHPVLLPCQHSLCYGCARAQILSHDNVEEIKEPDLSSTSNCDWNGVASPWLPPTRSRTELIPRLPDGQPPTELDTTFNNDDVFGGGASGESSFVLATNDCIHFENTKVLSPAPTSNALHPALLSSASSRSLTSSLRRSNSTSSVSRSIASKSRSQQIYGTLRRKKVKGLFCPHCRDTVELGKLGISGLFRNFVLESIVEKFRSKAKAAVAIRCGYCKPPASDATRSCLDCKLSYCNECYKIVHIWGTKKARHNFVGPTNNFSRPKVLLCPEHSNEVSMYCNKCKKSVCRQCKIGGGAHVNHSISSAKTACREGKERLCADMEKLRRKKEEVDAKLESLKEAFTELELRDAETRESIHASIDSVYRLLEAKRTELLTKAETKYRNNEQYLKQELQCHHQRLMATSIANFAEEVMKETDPVYFLQTSRMVELKLKEVLAHLSELEEVKIDIPSSNLHLDLESAKRELERIDFVEKEEPSVEPSTSSSAKSLHCGVERESFCWMLLNPDPAISFDVDKNTAFIPSQHLEPCILKGSKELFGDHHTWQVSVSSVGAKRVLIGVCNLNADEKLHGSIAHGRTGVFLEILPGYASLFHGGWPLESSPCTSTESAALRHRPISIGKHIFTVLVRLAIDHHEASVEFYEVRPGQTDRELGQKSFKCPSPVHPLVVVNGEATVKLD